MKILQCSKSRCLQNLKGIVEVVRLAPPHDQVVKRHLSTVSFSEEFQLFGHARGGCYLALVLLV